MVYLTSKLLIIDDSEFDLRVGEFFLRKFGISEQIIKQNSALLALEYLKHCESNLTEVPGLIFLDINMPEMNGFDFLDSFKTLSDNIKSHCNIIMLTSSMDENDYKRSYESTFVKGYIIKPLNEEKINRLKIELASANDSLKP